MLLGGVRQKHLEASRIRAINRGFTRRGSQKKEKIESQSIHDQNGVGGNGGEGARCTKTISRADATIGEIQRLPENSTEAFCD